MFGDGEYHRLEAPKSDRQERGHNVPALESVDMDIYILYNFSLVVHEVKFIVESLNL